ncbi:MAG: protein-glutamate O-methyltransferase CheR [Proteobacteria bacterium]|nr:protein-glutamate O-methyltransferase CheR [Pseudomonadota bacterium]
MPRDLAEEPLSPDHLRLLCAFLYVRTGMSYGETKRYFIERRVTDGMERAGLRSVPAYLSLLQTDNGEAEALINSFTVNETYFYREEHQLRCLGRSMLPEIVARREPGGLVRIWSVPCSTGEEPYSVAIWLLENWPLVDAYNIEILASDIDTRVLAAASVGDYGERALSRLSAEERNRYFLQEKDGVRRVIPDLRESVRFTHVNLMDAAGMAAHGRFDIIFCRNVLIYFDDVARLKAAQNLFEALNPGGFICLGHTESMSRISDRFTVRRFPDGVVFQRPGP